MDYLITGNFCVDTVLKDGKIFGPYASGPVVYAFCGVRQWTDNCQMVCNIGADAVEILSFLTKQKAISLEKLNVKTDLSTQIVIEYGEDGTYSYKYTLGEQLGAENFGHLRISPEELEPHLKGVKGVYIDQPVDEVFWEKMGKLREKYAFKIMWEIQFEPEKDVYFRKYRSAQIKKILPNVDIYSLNLNECKMIFDLETEEEIIKKIKEFNTPCFLRLGEKGACMIQDGESYFVPAYNIGPCVDSTGCGNCSTAVAMFAFCEGKDPYTIVIMANISAAYNTLNYGAINDFSLEKREKLFAMAEKRRRDHPSLSI